MMIIEFEDDAKTFILMYSDDHCVYVIKMMIMMMMMIVVINDEDGDDCR